MTDVQVQSGRDPSAVRKSWFRDNADGTFAEEHSAETRYWDTNSLTWVKGTQPGASSGGGGAVTVADGADVAQGTTTDLSSASTVVGILKAIKAAITGTLTTARTWTLSSATDSVNVGNFPATQAVSMATQTPDVTDRVARLLGHVTVDNASIPVTIATNTPDVTDRAARLLGIVDKGKLWDGTNIAAVKAASAVAAATDPALVVQHAPQRADASNLCVTVTAATGVAATLTIPAAAAGLFHYITLIEIELYATAARTGGATPVVVTTTNLPGSPAWDFDTGQAIGTTIRKMIQPATPIKSSVAATNTTIVAPIATTGIWRITAYYYTAP